MTSHPNEMATTIRYRLPVPIIVFGYATAFVQIPATEQMTEYRELDRRSAVRPIHRKTFLDMGKEQMYIFARPDELSNDGLERVKYRFCFFLKLSCVFFLPSNQVALAS